MRTIVYCFILFTYCSVTMASDWMIIPSNDGYWIKTRNSDNHELLLAYKKDTPYFLLMINAEIPVPDRSIPIWINIDNRSRDKTHLNFLQKLADKSIFQIAIVSDLNEDYILKMVSGNQWSIYFDQSKESRPLTFSLIGFTTALNDLLISNDIGTLEPEKLINDNKLKELYCYLKSDIIEQAFQHRALGHTYVETLHSIPKTEFSIIDNHIPDIVKQAYMIPDSDIPRKAGTFKHKNFKQCLRDQKIRINQ